MMGQECNIQQTDRVNRSVIGVLMILAALLGAGKVFFIILGVVLIVEGAIGWCAIPYIVSQAKEYWSKK